MGSEKGNPGNLGKKEVVYSWEHEGRKFRLMRSVSANKVVYYPEVDLYGSWKKTRYADEDVLREFASVVSR